MKTVAIIGTASETPASRLPEPPTALSWSVLIMAGISGGAWLVRWFVQFFETKEKAESAILAGLISNLQAQAQQLMADSRQSQTQLLEHIDLKDSVSRVAALMKDDLQRGLSTQTNLYAQGLENQAVMKGQLEALHRRDDQIVKLLNEILEELKRVNPK